MIGEQAFETFMRAAFAVEPGGRIGSQLEHIWAGHSLLRGDSARLDERRDKIVYIANGATKLCAQGSCSRAQIVAFHFGADIVSIPADGTHSYRLTALVQTDILEFPAREFFDCASRENAMARSLFDRLPAALHRCRDKTVALGCKNATERMAGFLCTMAQRIGRLEHNCGTLDLPMSRRDIGDSLGLTIETVSRQLGALKDAGLIETSGRSRIDLLDLASLETRAGHAIQSDTDNIDLIARPLRKIDLDQSAQSCAAVSH